MITLDGTPLSGDDSGLTEDERVLLERARALIPRLAERASAAAAARQMPQETMARVPRRRHPAHPAAEAVWRDRGPL
jgi:hypothetical protein